MDMTGEERIAAPRDVVWAALNDPDILKQCIPGCESLEKISPTELTATVKFKIGPVSASFNGEVTLSNINAPRELHDLRSKERAALPALPRAGPMSTLKEEGGETILYYEAKAQVGGKIAQLGSRLVDSSAKKLAQQFFADFTAAINGQATA